METVSTLIEFVEVAHPQGIVPATGDLIGFAIILAAFAFAIGAFIFVKMRNKSLVTGKHLSINDNKKPISIVFVIFASIFLAIGLTSNVSNAIAGPEGIASASEKVYAYVDTENNEVIFENGYIKSNIPADVNSVAVKIDMLDSPEFSYNFNWQVKIGDEVVYNGVAQDLKHDFYIDVKDSQTSFEITNLSVSDAKALAGKEVAKVSFYATTLKEVQSDAYFEIYDKVDASLDNISAIPTTSLLDEDRAAAKANISKILDDSFPAISETEDTAKLAEIVSKAQGDIQALVDSAIATAEQTVADKLAYINEQSASIASLKNEVDAKPLLNEQDKSEFKGKYDAVLQEVKGVNQVTSHSALVSLKADVSAKLASINTEINARIAQRFVEYKQNAVESVGELNTGAISDINDLDNMSQTTKGPFITAINDGYSPAIEAINASSTTDDVDAAVESYSSLIDDQVAAAEAINYRPWTIDTWAPKIDLSIMPGRDSILDAVAQVSSSDPYATYAPNPVYHIKETSSNNAYFSVETTEDFKAKIISNSSVPDGLYTVTVYATFGSVIDKGYTTNSNEVDLSVYIWTIPPLPDIEDDETFLWENTSNPIICDEWSSSQILSEGGLELIDAGAQVGDYINFYIYNIPTTADDHFWKLEIWGGHWEKMFVSYCEVGYPTAQEESRTEYYLDCHNGILSVQLTQEMLDYAYSPPVGWGGSFTLNGDSTACARATLKHSNTPDKKTLWIGDAVGDGFGNQPYLLSDAGVELQAAGAKVGDAVDFYLCKMPDAIGPEDYWKAQIYEGHWGPVYASICEFGADTEEGKYTEYDLAAHGGKYSLTLTQEILDAACTQQWWGGTFLLNADNTICTGIALIPSSTPPPPPPPPSEQTLWEGEPIEIGLTEKYVLSDAGIELMEAGAEVGDYVNFEFTDISSDDSWVCHIYEGHWGPLYASICGYNYYDERITPEKYNLSEHDGKYSLQLTQTMLDAAYNQQWWGGTFLLQGEKLLCSKITLSKTPY